MADKEGYHLIGCGCKSHFCPNCCVGLGWKLRQKLLAAVQSWSADRPIMVTCTIDRTNFENPQEAFEYVHSRGLVSRFVRELKRRYGGEIGHYFAVLEFQMESGEGWPHWHILLDASFVPHALLTDCWNAPGPAAGKYYDLGMVYVTKSSGFVCREHAANYATKYLVKFPRDGYPEWVLKREGIFKRYSSSKGLFRDLELEELEAAAKRVRELQEHGYPPEWDMADEVDEYDQWLAFGDCEEAPEPVKRGQYGRVAASVAGRVDACGRRVTLIEYRHDVTSAGEVKETKRWVASGRESLSTYADLLGIDIERNRIVLSFSQAASVVDHLARGGGVVAEVQESEPKRAGPVQRDLFEVGGGVFKGVGQ